MKRPLRTKKFLFSAAVRIACKRMPRSCVASNRKSKSVCAPWRHGARISDAMFKKWNGK